MREHVKNSRTDPFFPTVIDGIFYILWIRSWGRTATGNIFFHLAFAGMPRIVVKHVDGRVLDVVEVGADHGDVDAAGWDSLRHLHLTGAP